MENYSKDHHIIVKNNPCFINHLINDQYVLPLDGFFELILIYLIKKRNLVFPISFADLQIKKLLTADNLQSEKNINLRHDLATNEINIQDISIEHCSLLSGFVSATHLFEAISLPESFAHQLTFQEIYTHQQSETHPFYHSIQEILYDKNHALATIHSSLGKNFLSLFYNDVTVLNGVFIALINFCMSLNQSSQLYLPYYLRKLSFFKKIEQGQYVLHLKREEDNCFSLRLMDEHHALVLAADGVELKLFQKDDASTLKINQSANLDTDPIAIIGMSGRFPKAQTIDEFWMKLCDGYDGISKIAAHRSQDFLSESKSELTYGGFFDDLASFDARFFDISGHEAVAMEPQQRLFLESAWEALEQAGYANIKQLNCGVYLGITQGDYLSVKHSEHGLIPQSFWGNAPSIAASRLSYFLDLKGPAIAVDTACSSSLTALHMACEALRAEDLELAIAGGVFVTVTDQFHQKAFRANMLSPEHQCFAFSSKANGFVPGEAVSAVVLKRLSQAEKDGDFIHALIIGSGINQDGRTNGIIAPNSESQSALQRSVYEKFHINPTQISYVETHGTGTKLGDPIELQGLQKTFETYTQEKQFCAIGSVKSNIGHTAAAAGMASLIKVCLSLRYHTIPVSRHLQVTNPDIDFNTTAFYPAKKTTPWESDNPRMAAINSFGFSGTNAHVVLKEYRPKGVALKEKESYFFPFSAKTFEDLLGYMKKFGAWLSAYPAYDLNSICYTLSCRRKHFESRFIIVAAQRESLLEAIHYLAGLGSHQLEAMGYYQCPSIKEHKESPILADFLSKKEVYWLDYFKSERPSQVPLPTYHWKKSEYWPRPLTYSSIHPSTIFFDINNQIGYVKDHVVNGSLILPAAAYIAFCHSALDKNMSLRDVYFLSPLIVMEDQRLFLEMDALQHEFAFKIGNKTYCHGGFQKNNNPCTGVTSNNNYSQVIKKQEIYERLLSQNLFYGESLSKLESIAYNENELYAHAHLASADDLIALLDVSLQATVVFNVEKKNYLPFYINEINIYSIPQHDAYIFARKVGVSELSLHFDIVIVDSNHQVCIDLKGVEVRASVKSETSSARLYYREMQEVVFDKLSNLDLPIKSSLLLDNTHFNPNDWQETLGHLISHFSIVKINLENPQFDFIEKYEKTLVNELSIYFLTTAVIVSDDLVPTQWIFNFLQRLLHVKIPTIRLVLIFNEANAVQIAALEGLMRSLRLETEKLQLHLIRINGARTIGLALKNALHNPSILNHNDVSQEDRLYRLPTYRELLSTPNTKVLKKNGIYVITGGTGGLGLQLVQYLTSQYQATVIVISRRINPNLPEAVHQYPCDIAQKNTLSSVIEAIKQQFPVINGLFHLAGVLDDKLFVNATWNSFYQIIAPKLLGVVYLNELTKTLPLDFFCCFSSLSSYAGNFGQSAYAYANSFLDNYMRHREKLKEKEAYFGFSQSINWPLWKVGGMGNNQLIQAAALKRWQLPAIDSHLAFSLLEKSLNSKQTNVLVANDNLVSNTSRTKVGPVPHTRQVDLINIFSEALKIPIEDIYLEKPFVEYGIDSLLAVAIVEKLSLYEDELPKSLLLELTNLAELTEYLASKRLPAVKETAVVTDTPELNLEAYAKDDIAIIGLSGKYPDADNLEIFWHNLRQNKLSITSLSTRKEHVWPYEWAGLINRYDYFDPLFFKISPLDAIKMDPQERQFLQIAYHAFENAGYPKQRLKQDQRVGVYVGVMYGLYALNALDQSRKGGEAIIGNSTYASIANRVSYCLDLQGPSMAIDSMCSSSLTAVHLGIQSLLSHETNMVLCGGVNLITHPYKYEELLQKSFLATDGLCHSFAADGDGYVPGEGVGALVLKRLSDAIRDNDHIHGVIKASAINHGGFSSGYTVPKKVAQQKLLSEVLEKSGLSSRDIHYIEAHGTGTSLGDPIEYRALAEVYGHDTFEKMYIGSIKANVGHLESAAGVASITKVLLQMRHQQITPHLLHGPINSNLTQRGNNFEFSKGVVPWQQHQKNAAISSFGAGGSNAHLIVSYYKVKEILKKEVTAPVLLCVSAHTEKGLIQKWQQLHAWLVSQTEIDLIDLSYTLAVARDHFQYKSVLVCYGYADLLNNIQGVSHQKFPDNYFDHRQEWNGLHHTIQKKALAYFDQITPTFDDWFLDTVPNLLDLPLYPYEEFRYNLLNTGDVEPILATLKKQRWVCSDAPSRNETKLIEHCLVIFNGDYSIALENINQSNCFLLDLSKHQLNGDVDRGVQWLRSTRNWKILDLVGVSNPQKGSFEQQFSVYLHFLKKVGNEPLRLYQFALSGNEFSEFNAQLEALFYVIQAEYNWIHCVCIELDDLHLLTKAYYSEQKSVQSIKVKYAQGVRYIRESYVPISEQSYQTKLNPNAYYLVTGGSSGIGYLTAKHLVSLGAKKLILMGITELPDESCETLSKKQKTIMYQLTTLREKHIEVKHIACSLNNKEELFNVLQPLKKNIAGIIHAAGLTDFKLERIQNKTLKDFQEHINIKYLGLKNLLDVYSLDDLDFIFSFSSMSSAHPKEARGISCYAFSNHLMDSYIEALSLRFPGKFLSMRWPLWRESRAGQLSQTSMLETDDAYALFDQMLTAHRDGAVNIELGVPALKQSIVQEPRPNAELPNDNSTLQWLTDYFVNQMKVPHDRIDIDKSFIEYGVDSILLLGLINALETHLGQAVAPTIILENPTLRKLSSYFYKQESGCESPTSPSLAKTNDNSDEFIAIIGASGRFPGAEDLTQFWDNLFQGRSSIRNTPNDRLGEINASEKAGFITDLKYFDPHYFGFSETYARQLDPLIRLSLELSIESILNAGYTSDEFRGKNCAVIVAARAANYVNYLESFSKDTISGIGQNFLAAQVSQYFNLSGPSYVIDSACSSSLTAIHLACQHLKTNDIDYALVTGVELFLDNRPFDLLRAGGALSPSQQCRPFAENADGIMLGEGGGSLILKRLKDAIADGDKIEAIIRGGAINNDGQTMGMTTPNPQSQTAVVKQALHRAKIQPESISYIETHATGTPIGDPMELAALTNVFVNENQAYCGVGSVKANIGHLLSAAGMASILKVVLAMKHQTLPKSLGCTVPNKRYQFEKSPFYLMNENMNWLRRDKIRSAGVSGFGFGGTNVHLILSEFDPAYQENYIQKRFELIKPKYHKQYLWPKSPVQKEPDEAMDAFFEVVNLE